MAGDTPDAESNALAFCFDSDIESNTGPFVCFSDDPLSASGLELSSDEPSCDSLTATDCCELLTGTTGRDESVVDASGDGMAATTYATVDAEDVSLKRDT